MTGWSVLLLGVGLGLSHATDADHVVAVSALVQREPGMWRAARIAALWGAGHTASFLGLGLLVILAGVQVPAAYEAFAEALVAVMLVGLGIWHLWHGRQTHAPEATASAATAYARPALIGVVHGLAGSAGIALFAATTIASRPLAAAYLALFGMGTMLGMVALTVVMARPLRWTMRREGPLKQGVILLAALSSIALGLSVAVHMVLGEAAP